MTVEVEEGSPPTVIAGEEPKVTTTGGSTIIESAGSGVSVNEATPTILISDTGVQGPPGTGGGGSDSLDDLLDVTITAVANNELLAYDTVLGWINQTAAEAGLSEIGHTHDDRYYTEAEIDALIAGIITEVNWGDIGGTLSNQTDLQSALDLKYNASNPSGYISNLTSFTTTNLTEGTNLYFTDERAQDAVGNILTDSATVDFSYNDALNTITASVIQAGLDHGSIGGLSDDDHSIYLLASAATNRATFAANWTDLTDTGGTTLHQHDSRYYTETELDAGQLDNRYFTESEINAFGFLTGSSTFDSLAQTSLADPNADRIVFWDDSDTQHEYLTPNTGLSISGNNLNVGGLTVSEFSSANISQWTNNSGYLTSVDISSNTNLGATAPIVLTGDTLSLNFDYDFTGASKWTGDHVFAGAFTIGDGTAGVDPLLTFNGEDDDFTLQWFEDEKRFVAKAIGGAFSLIYGDISTDLGSLLDFIVGILPSTLVGFSGDDALVFAEAKNPALAAGPLFVGIRNTGAAVVDNNGLSVFGGAGSTGDGQLPTAGQLVFYADDNWSATSTPTRAEIQLCPSGSIDIFNTVATFNPDRSTILHGNATIGSGTAGIDYSLTFNGETNDGIITWMEDEDYFVTDLISSPHTGTGSERFGAGSSAASNYATAFGNSASAGEECVAIGDFASSSNAFGSGSGSVAIGSGADATLSFSVAIGANANAGSGTFANTAIGAGANANGSFYQTAIGADSIATGTAAVAIGAGAEAAGSGALTMGSSSHIPSGQDRCTVLGGSCNATGGTADDIVVIGNNSNSGFASTLVIGTTSASTAANQAVLGGSGGTYSKLILGNGAGSIAATATVTYTGTEGSTSGSNRIGSAVIIQGGLATGNAASGYVAITTAPAGSSGATPQTPIERFRFKVSGEAVFNDGALDYDLRVEGTSDADLFTVDASTNRVGISTNAPAELFDVDGLSRSQTFTADGDVGSGTASTVRLTGVTDTPTVGPGWATSDTVAMTPPDGYIKFYVGTQAVTVPYWNT